MVNSSPGVHPKPRFGPILDSTEYVHHLDPFSQPSPGPCPSLFGPLLVLFFNNLVHRSTNTGLGSTTSAPRGGDTEDNEQEVRTGRSQGSRPSGHARTKEEAR